MNKTRKVGNIYRSKVSMKLKTAKEIRRQLTINARIATMKKETRVLGTINRERGAMK